MGGCASKRFDHVLSVQHVWEVTHGSQEEEEGRGQGVLK
jgi:hypothetical protein